MAAASAAASPRGTISPCRSSVTMPLVPPASVATIGVSSAIASSTAFGVPSESELWTNTSNA